MALMKSQDIFLLFKLIAESQAQGDARQAIEDSFAARLPKDRQGWDDALSESASEIDAAAPAGIAALTVRGLESSLGLSKSEISQSLKRLVAVGLALRSPLDGVLRANAPALYEFVVHGLKYVFPAQPGASVRGIPTGIDAPVLHGILASAGSHALVWPDPQGKAQGQSIKPLYRSVPHAVRRDPNLYAALALIDAIRLGRPREAGVAAEQLKVLMGLG